MTAESRDSKMSDAENDHESQQLLAAARNGDPDALVRLMERCRGVLDAQAARELDSRLRVRASVSDVFQQTSLSAVNQIAAFRGTTMGEFIAWLKKIQRNNLLDIARDNKAAGKRSLKTEQAVDGAPGGPEAIADRRNQTPSRVAQSEEAVAGIHRVIDSLPDDQRMAVRLRVLEELPIRTIAVQMQRTDDAVAGLLKRGLASLRRQLESVDE